jgi:serine/threonine protein kinase
MEEVHPPSTPRPPADPLRFARGRTLSDFFEVGASVGRGTFGEVFVVTAGGRKYAAKKIHLYTTLDRIDAENEAMILRNIDSDTVVRFRDAFLFEGSKRQSEQDDRTLFSVLLMEYVEMTLKDWEVQARPVCLAEVADVTYQIVRGVCFLHNLCILHRDLKPQNVLYQPKTRKVKIADLGSSRHFTHGNTLTRCVATIRYRSPEVMLGERHYGPPVDFWAVGCIADELAKGRPAFPGASEIETLFMVFRRTGTPSAQDWPEITSLEYFNSNFPQWQPLSREIALGPLAQSTEAVHLVEGLLTCKPSARLCGIAAADAAAQWVAQ